MRKIVSDTIIISLLIIVVVVVNKGMNTTSKITSKKASKEIETKRLPLFEFYTLDSIPFSRYDLKKDTSLILIYFDPDCDLCEKSGEIFHSFSKLHKSSQIIFVSTNTKDKIKAYQERFKLEDIPNIQFMQCDDEDFYTLFKETVTPSYLIYNTKQELIKVINDDVPVKTILRYIKAAQIDQ